MESRHYLRAFAVAMGLCVLLENWPPLDLAVQQFFYRQGDWMITKADHAALRWFWYVGVKVFVACVGVAAPALAFLSLKTAALKKWRHFFCVVTLCIVLIPSITAGLKAVTGVYSPCDVLPFGGNHPYMGMLTHLWHYGVVDGGRSFPAGHASGGFALMSLYYAPVAIRFRRAGAAFGLAMGWGMGLYQMARGEHFFTHTLTTMFLACAVIICVNYACEYAATSLRFGRPALFSSFGLRARRPAPGRTPGTVCR